VRGLLYAALLLYASALLGSASARIRGGARPRVLSSRFMAAGFAAHTGALVLRVASTGHAPMAGMYETLAFYGWTTVLVSLIVVYRYGERTVELVTLPAAMLATAFSLANIKPGGPLALILRTRWFELHVTASFAAYSLFTLAFAGALLYIVCETKGASEEELKRFQEIASRSVLWGFFLFSVSMFAGAVWAYLAWGRYWLWEPKVLWSFIVWFYYAGAMHAYFVRDWRGRGLSIATLIGFAVVLFTYLGVGLLMKSSHSF